MKFCEKCGKELLDDSKFCQFCGAEVITSVDSIDNKDEHSEVIIEENKDDLAIDNNQNAQEQIPVKVQTKKKLILSKKLMIICASVLVVLIVLGVVIGKTVSQNKYKKKLESVYQDITYGAEMAESYATLESKVWFNCIHKNSSIETDKYTKNGYSYYSDFNDALSSFYEGESSKYFLISSNVSLVNESMSELKNYPKSLKSEYLALKELYISYSNLTDLVVGSSSYSYNTFSDALEKAKSDYRSALSSAKLLLE